MVNILFLFQGGKTKILFPIYYEQERPPTAGVVDGVIEREQYLTDVQRFSRDQPLPHHFADDSPWYLIQPGQCANIYCSLSIFMHAMQYVLHACRSSWGTMSVDDDRGSWANKLVT